MAASSLPSKTRHTPRIRIATLADKDGWINAQLTGYGLDPSFTWRYPKLKEYPEDARKATGNVFETVLGIESMTCLVAELPKIDDEESGNAEWVVVAAAIWEWKDWKEVDSEPAPPAFSSPSSSRRDMDPVRQKLFIDTITAAEKKYFGPEWGEKRLVLSDLTADPKYHRRGAGKALMEWGLEKAKEHRVPITLTSSPLGRYLYTHLGFKELGHVDCGVEGEEKMIRTWIMIWVPEGWEKKTISNA